MSNHAPKQDPEMSETLKRFAKRGGDAQEALDRLMETTRPENIGKTGKFPQGKLTDLDEGEVVFRIFHYENKVIIDFGTPVEWIAIDRNQALELARTIRKHGKAIKED